jgi:2-amino-4-hydroxy-6-hydroxymethyldihydropteridine diphosphokinase
MRNAEFIEAFVALGSNLGDSRQILEAAFARLQELSAAPIRRSSFWRSAPVNCPPGAPDFLNAAAIITTHPGETPESLLGKLKKLEAGFGRQPKCVMNEPRPLDLDLIVFGQEQRATPGLTLPHPRAHQRRFVLAPLAEIAPDAVWPGPGATIAELLAVCPPDASLKRE